MACGNILGGQEMGGRIFVIINGKKYRVTFGPKYTSFNEVGTMKLRFFNSTSSLKDVKRALK
jgi:hypothetical protein